MEDIDGTKAALLESMRILLPPFDVAAQKPGNGARAPAGGAAFTRCCVGLAEDVFNIRGIIGDEEWGAIARQV